MHLGDTYRSVKVYDPTIGTTPIETHRNVNSVSLVVSDHPVIIEILASASGVAP